MPDSSFLAWPFFDAAHRELAHAIRRAAPKYYGDYERSLPPAEFEPRLTTVTGSERPGGMTRATVHVTDNLNRAIADLTPEDFELLEGTEPREIVSVRHVEAPVNLVLLLDVSGSIENYVTFIRKAARAFVETVDDRDRISIVIFNEDVKVLADFTTDKRSLSESLDTFDAGEGEGACPELIVATSASDKARTAKLLEKRGDVLEALIGPASFFPHRRDRGRDSRAVPDQNGRVRCRCIGAGHPRRRRAVPDRLGRGFGHQGQHGRVPVIPW